MILFSSPFPDDLIDFIIPQNQSNPLVELGFMSHIPHIFPGKNTNTQYPTSSTVAPYCHYLGPSWGPTWVPGSSILLSGIPASLGQSKPLMYSHRATIWKQIRSPYLWTSHSMVPVCRNSKSRSSGMVSWGMELYDGNYNIWGKKSGWMMCFPFF